MSFCLLSSVPSRIVPLATYTNGEPMPVMPRTQSAGVAASGIDPIYRTSAFLNVGDELNARGLSVEVISIPSSRMAYDINPESIADALQGRSEFSPNAPTVSTTRRMVGPEALPTALAWTITAAAVRVHDRRDLDPDPEDLNAYARTWGDLSPVMEGQILGAMEAPLFVVENSPPAFQTAANFASGGLVTVSYATGHMNAATLLVAASALFVINAVPTPARALGQYVADLIEKLPGSNAGND